MKYVAVLVIFLALPIVNASIDKPSWSIGDGWDYTGTLQYSLKLNDEMMGFSVDGDVQISFLIKLDVEDTIIKEIDGEPKACYIVNMDSTIEGQGFATIEITNQSKVYQINVDLDINVDADGKTYLTTEEIAVVESDLTTDTNLVLTVDAPGVPDLLLRALGLVNKEVHLHNETVTRYTPPLDFMDFPIEDKEKWTVNSTVEYTTDQKSPTTMDLVFSFVCKDLGKYSATVLSDYVPFIGEITIDFMGYPIPLLNFQNTTFIWSEREGMMERIMNSEYVKEEGIEVSSDLDLHLENANYNPNENKKPTAEISYTPESPSTGTPISFEAKANDPDGEILYYHWDFGDGSTSDRQNPSHTYSKGGDYPVKLTVIDNYGAKTVVTKTISVEGGDGGNTPGFETLLALFAFIAISLKRRKAKN